MQLDDLRYFSNIAASGSFAKGAALSHISPPAASKAVRRLEEELGVELFTRTTRRVALTQSGEALLDSCRRIFDELERLEGGLHVAGSQVRGDLRIAAMEVFSIQLLPWTISELVAEYPEVRPRIYEMIPQQMEDLLQQGRIDVGFTIGGGGVRGLEYHRLGVSKGVLVCGKQHPLYRGGRISAAQLEEHPFVIPEFFGMEHLPVLDQFPDDRYRRKVGATIELLQMAVQLVVVGRHLGYFPEVSVRAHLESGRLKALRGLRHQARFDLRAITRKEGSRKQAVTLLIERLRRAVRGARASRS